MKRTGMLTFVTMAGLAATTLALADKDASVTRAGENATDQLTPRIHMIAAIAIAESATRGRAVQAELETDEERLAYEVEVLVDRSMRTVRVDATTAEVLPAKEEASKAARANEAKTQAAPTG